MSVTRKVNQFVSSNVGFTYLVGVEDVANFLSWLTQLELYYMDNEYKLFTFVLLRKSTQKTLILYSINYNMYHNKFKVLSSSSYCETLIFVLLH